MTKKDLERENERLVKENYELSKVVNIIQHDYSRMASKANHLTVEINGFYKKTKAFENHVRFLNHDLRKAKILNRESINEKKETCTKLGIVKNILSDIISEAI